MAVLTFDSIEQVVLLGCAFLLVLAVVVAVAFYMAFHGR